jgi:hypothetical protein
MIKKRSIKLLESNFLVEVFSYFPSPKKRCEQFIIKILDYILVEKQKATLNEFCFINSISEAVDFWPICEKITKCRLDFGNPRFVFVGGPCPGVTWSGPNSPLTDRGILPSRLSRKPEDWGAPADSILSFGSGGLNPLDFFLLQWERLLL